MNSKNYETITMETIQFFLIILHKLHISYYKRNMCKEGEKTHPSKERMPYVY